MTWRRTLLAGLAAAGAGAAALRGWYRHFDWVTTEDEHHVVETDDGWRLALYRYRPEPGVALQPYPVVCGHGLAGTHFIYDLGPDVSLARFLARAGFDVYTVDLRGRGSSWPSGGPHPDLHWSFDDFVRHDLPAAVRKACEVAGAGAAFWLGQEMSGQALYAAAVTGTAGQVRAGVTFGAPAVTPLTAAVPGVTSAPKVRRGGRVPFRAGSRLAGPVLAYTRAGVLESSFRPAHTAPEVTARYLRCGIPDESTLLVDQFTDWVDGGVMATLNGTIRYSELLGDVRLPLLLVVGAADRQRPPEAVHGTYEALGSADKTLFVAGLASGCAADFGHDDLLAGRSAATDVFPRVADWLAAHC